MKKTYRKPSIKAINRGSCIILAGSENLGYGGSNSGGGPSEAESKSFVPLELDDEELR